MSNGETILSASLVRGRFVITGLRGDGTPIVLRDAALVIRDGKISEAGPFALLRQGNEELPVVGHENALVCPGFVNGHHHVGITPLQLGIPDLPLELWVIRRLATRSVDPYLDTLYSGFELLASGVTTVQHLNSRVPRPVGHIVETANQIIRAYQDLGMRVSYSYAVRDQNRLAYEADEAVLRQLPSHLTSLAGEMLAEQTLSVEESLSVFDQLHAIWSHRDDVGIQLAPVNLQWCSDDALLRVAEKARSHRVPMHMHLLETFLQRDYAAKRTGGTAVEHLNRLGLLGPDLTIGHGVWVSDSDIALLADKGTCLCHNCSSNLRLRSGTAPLMRYIHAGVRVGLGIDEAGLNDDRDMLQEMRLVLNLHRPPGLSIRDTPSAAQVFRMATEDGAATTSFAGRIGRLDIGYAADLCIFDWDGIALPYLDDNVPILDGLLRRARAGHIESVMVGGEVVLHNGVFRNVDRLAVLEELAAQLRAPLPVEQLARQAVADAVLDFGRRLYGAAEPADAVWH